jgi:hypothetical protein
MRRLRIICSMVLVEVPLPDKGHDDRDHSRNYLDHWNPLAILNRGYVAIGSFYDFFSEYSVFPENNTLVCDIDFPSCTLFSLHYFLILGEIGFDVGRY